MRNAYQVNFGDATLSRIDQERILHHIIGQGLWLTDVHCRCTGIVSTESKLEGTYQVSGFRSTMGYRGSSEITVTITAK